jgi:hypothetical protein
MSCCIVVRSPATGQPRAEAHRRQRVLLEERALAAGDHDNSVVGECTRYVPTLRSLDRGRAFAWVSTVRCRALAWARCGPPVGGATCLLWPKRLRSAGARCEDLARAFALDRG